jgi:hypothetical protein
LLPPMRAHRDKASFERLGFLWQLTNCLIHG